jgi:hypothetical protein
VAQSNDNRWVVNIPTDSTTITRLTRIAGRAGFDRWGTEYVFHTDTHYLVISTTSGEYVRVPYPELDNYLTALELVHGTK